VDQQLLADRGPHVLPVDHRLEVTSEVCPTDLAAMGG
jgi:hypothetical protein